jgi:hypothetical protein
MVYFFFCAPALRIFFLSIPKPQLTLCDLASRGDIAQEVKKNASRNFFAKSQEPSSPPRKKGNATVTGQMKERTSISASLRQNCRLRASSAVTKSGLLQPITHH